LQSIRVGEKLQKILIPPVIEAQLRTVKPHRADKIGIFPEQFQQRPGDPHPGNTDRLLLRFRSPDPFPAGDTDVPDVYGSEKRGAHGAVFDPAAEDPLHLADKIIPQGICPFPYHFLNRVKGKGAEGYEEDEYDDMRGKGIAMGAGFFHCNPGFRSGFSKIFHQNPRIPGQFQNPLDFKPALEKNGKGPFFLSNPRL
jgi:hypothetical protein